MMESWTKELAEDMAGGGLTLDLFKRKDDRLDDNMRKPDIKDASKSFGPGKCKNGASIF